MAEKMLRCKKTPTDAELEAERDRKHQKDVEDWLSCVDDSPEDDEW